MAQSFAELKAEQQAGARMALQQVTLLLGQAANEWADGAAAWHPQPAGYLFGIIHSAMRGEFNNNITNACWQTGPAPLHHRRRERHHPSRRATSCRLRPGSTSSAWRPAAQDLSTGSSAVK